MTTNISSKTSNLTNDCFCVVETTISEIHQAIKTGIVTFRELTETYIQRIQTFDKSTGLNSIVVINSNSLKRADELDEEFKNTGELRPLHGIPVIVKDNYDTMDMQTSAGSLALKGSIPPDDSYQVKRLREAGAIILVKSNMAEWAFSPYQTVSSIAGTTRNPYDLERVPAGSSGGTAAAVAASLGVVGLGTDTGNSIRGPSSHTCLVGIRPTMGLTSRDGIVPLHLRNDMGGPMTRTVEDAARLLEVIAGYDAADPVTKHCIGKIPDSYTEFLEKDGLNDVRIGVFRYYTDMPSADIQVKELYENAIEDMKLNGAVMIDPFEIPNFDELTEDIWCRTFKFDLQDYLSSLIEAKYRSLEEIEASGLYSSYIEERLKNAVKIKERPTCGDLYNEPRNIRFREAILAVMEENDLNAFIYPTWNNPPRKIGDLDSPAGDNSQKIPPHTGFPAITVPMGFTYSYLPAGLQIVGRLFSEPEIIKIAYSYEQATNHRLPPEHFPEL